MYNAGVIASLEVIEVIGLRPRSYHFVRQNFADANTHWFRRSAAVTSLTPLTSFITYLECKVNAFSSNLQKNKQK